MPLRKKVLIVTAASFAAILGAVLTTAAIVRDAAADPPQAEPFSLTPLPYAEGALVPYISAETVSYHYHKHYQGYVNNLNKLTAGKPEPGRNTKRSYCRLRPARSSTTRPKSGTMPSIGTALNLAATASLPATWPRLCGAQALAARRVRATFSWKIGL